MLAQAEQFGNYVLTAHLGRGGMADVFRARRTGVAGFERVVVVKRILSQFNSDPQFVQMFIDEAKIAASLQHPNIAQVHELGEIDGEYFMVVEYVKGMDLLHVLRALAKRPPAEDGRRTMPSEVACFVAREIGRALAHAHDHKSPAGQAQPIVHRDVSPQNIMVGYDGQVKLVDFGIAKAMYSVREETRTGALKGKIAYMSPEQVIGDSPGPESDVFALGVVLYEMLIGKRLFKGQNDFETLNRVKSMPIPPPSRVAPWVPAELDDIVLRSLERDRSRRYKRASMMVRDLDAWLAQQRFSTEQMAEWMSLAFPPETRLEVPDGHMVTPEPASRSRSSFGSKLQQPRSDSNPGGSGSNPGSGSGVGPLDQPPHEMTTPGTARSLRVKGVTPSGGGSSTAASRVALVLGIVLVAAGAGVGGALFVMSRQKAPTTAPLPVTPAVAPPVTPPPTKGEPAGTTATAPTDPNGPGPNGPTDPNDPRHDPRHHAATAAGAAKKPGATTKDGAGTGQKKPRIQAFDDEGTPSPKIQTFDD